VCVNRETSHTPRLNVEAIAGKSSMIRLSSTLVAGGLCPRSLDEILVNGYNAYPFVVTCAQKYWCKGTCTLTNHYEYINLQRICQFPA
jgi:hypothetical protein